MDYGFLSCIPVLSIMVISIITRRTLFALAMGLGLGCIIMTDSLARVVSGWFDYIYTSMSNEDLQWLILVVMMFGMLIDLYEKSGAVQDFGNWAHKFIKTEKTALYGTMFMGIVIFVDDYLNNLAVSTTMRSITDKFRIPRSELAAVVNVTSAPVCLLIPLSTWAVYFATLMGNQGVEVNGSSLTAYIHALPFTFYAWIILIIIALQIAGIVPKIGPIKKDYKKAKETGDLFPDGTEPELIEQYRNTAKVEIDTTAKPWNFLIPLVVMIVVTIVAGLEVLYGATAGVAIAFFMYLIERKMSFYDLLRSCYDGVMSMGYVIMLCVLSFALQAANADIDIAGYLINLTTPIMKGAFLPMVVFLVGGIYSYASGCFWDLAAIFLPIVIPMANAMGVDPILASAAVFSAAAFGHNTCIYGDGVILCSQGCQIKPVNLMLSMLPYTLIAAGCSAIAFLVAGFILT